MEELSEDETKSSTKAWKRNDLEKSNKFQEFKCRFYLFCSL